MTASCWVRATAGSLASSGIVEMDVSLALPVVLGVMLLLGCTPEATAIFPSAATLAAAFSAGSPIVGPLIAGSLGASPAERTVRRISRKDAEAVGDPTASTASGTEAANRSSCSTLFILAMAV